MELGLILWSVQVESAKNPPFLQAVNPVVAPKFFFVLPAERLCPFNSKNLECLHVAIVELSWKQDVHFSLTSHVPIGFVCSVWALLCLSCSVSLQSLKKLNDSCFSTPKLCKIVESVFVWQVYTFVQKLACFPGKGIYLSAKLLKTWWWCLAKWSSLEIFKGLWEFQLAANLP